MAQPEDTVRKKPRDTEPQGFFLINLNLTYEKTITREYAKCVPQFVSSMELHTLTAVLEAVRMPCLLFQKKFLSCG